MTRSKLGTQRSFVPVAAAPIYFDNHATTPIDERVASVVMGAMQVDFGNANSTDHQFGQTAAALVEEARLHVAALVDADADQVHFTSGSTESIHLAIAHAIGTKQPIPLRIALTRVEHKAVIDTALNAQRQGLATIAWIEVDEMARIVWESLQRALDAGVDLVCAMAANNEVGTIYPVSDVARLVHDQGAMLLVDSTQGAGRMPISTVADDIDYLIFNGHKINGPKGVGALVSNIYDPSRIHGLAGSHRPTPNVPGIAGFGEACRLLILEGAEENARLARLRDRLQLGIVRNVPGIVVNGYLGNRLPNNLHISAPGAPNDLMISRLSNIVALSTGSACTSGAQTPSHVLSAMRMSEAGIDSSLRIGLGRQTSAAEVDLAITAITAAIAEVRAILGNGHD